MKSILRTLLTTLALTALARAGAPSGWTDDYDKAMEKAKTEKKNVLLDFTGSDWCGFCIALDKEVFSTAKFKTWAKNNAVLVQLDFPHGKRLSSKLQKQNDELKTKFGASGFPTIVVLDAEGKVLTKKTGYDPGTGAEAWLHSLNLPAAAKP